jgi:K+/H+ antiporter YhaU regulatory subunit KhtT
VDVVSGSSLIGQTMGQAKDKAGITVLAMRKQNGNLIPNPPDGDIMEEGDRLIIIGTKQRLGALEKILTGKKRGKE